VEVDVDAGRGGGSSLTLICALDETVSVLPDHSGELRVLSSSASVFIGGKQKEEKEAKRTFCPIGQTTPILSIASHAQSTYAIRSS
jgi:hypothetical protein